jgi:non-specific protein-tyrosine kinase
MELKQYYALVKKWILLLLFGTVLGGVAAFVVSESQTRIYAATAEVFISQPPQNSLSDLGYLSGQQLIQTYVELMSTDKVLDETSSLVEYPISKGNLSISQVRDTQIIQVTVKLSDPNKAAEIANTLVLVFSQQQYDSQTSRYAESKASLENTLAEQRQIIETNMDLLGSFPESGFNQGERDRIEGLILQAQNTYATVLQSYETLRIAEAQSYSLVELVDPAEPNRNPVAPKVITNTLLGLVVGALIAGGIAFLVEYVDDTVNSPQEMNKKFGIVPIGYVGIMSRSGINKKGYLVVKDEPRSPTSEAFRGIRTNIEFANVSYPTKTILITSPSPEEGKTTIVANLALVMAQEGKRVGIMDCDLRRPRIHKLFGVTNRVGITDVLWGKVSLATAFLKAHRNVYIAPSGKLPPFPAELLGSKQMTDLLEEAKEFVDVVLLDSPPAIVTDSIILSTKVDGVIIVVVPKKTKVNSIQLMMDQMNRAEARIIGTIYNKLGRNNSYYYYNPPYYYYSDTKSSSNGNRKKRSQQKKSRREIAK